LHRSPVLFTSSIALPGGKQAVRGREATRKSATDKRNTCFHSADKAACHNV
jgi:hypothetical protein